MSKPAKPEPEFEKLRQVQNVASRIEGMTRSYPVEILRSESTRQAIGPDVPRYQIATVQVKNRLEPLVLWLPDPPLAPARPEGRG